MRRFVLLSLWAGSIVVAQACGGTTDTDDGGLDASNDVTTTIDNFVPPPDTGVEDVVIPDDTSTGDAGTDVVVVDAAPDTGSKIQTWTCGNTTVTDCAQCIGHTTDCVYCGNQDASVLSGVCVQSGQGCGQSAPQGFGLCTCPKDASTCPQPDMVCLQATQQTSVCDPCSAVNTTNGLTCQNGLKCQFDAGTCL